MYQVRTWKRCFRQTFVGKRRINYS